MLVRIGTLLTRIITGGGGETVIEGPGASTGEPLGLLLTITQA